MLPRASVLALEGLDTLLTQLSAEHALREVVPLSGTRVLSFAEQVLG